MVKFSYAREIPSQEKISGRFQQDLWKMEKPALKVPSAKPRKRPGPLSGFMTTVCIPCLISEYAWKTIAKIATDVIEKMDILVSNSLNIEET